MHHQECIKNQDLFLSDGLLSDVLEELGASLAIMHAQTS
jgi:hypothetical protein